MATLAIPVPVQSAYDPPVEGEGRLDPLGLGSIADRIADTYARPVRARMRRIRFLTSMALGAQVTQDLVDVEPAVPGDTPEIAFERVVIEALARAGASGMELDTGIPGITKAQSALLAKSRLSARGYLKSPRVFGFFGVYRPLALATGLLDDRGGPLPAGEDLAQAMFADARESSAYETDPSSDEFVSWLTNAVGNGLSEGRNTFARRSPNVVTLARIAAPEAAGLRERAALSQVLHSPVGSFHPEDERAYLDVLNLMTKRPDLISEMDWVDYLSTSGSPALASRMAMLLAFEQFARDLMWAFDSYRFLSSKALNHVPSDEMLADDPAMVAVALTIADRYQTTLQAMEAAGDFGVDLELASRFATSFGEFDRAMSIGELVEALMQHHGEVQRGKPPQGKRMWLEDVNGRWECRSLFEVHEPVDRLEEFLHPYRFNALARFLSDLHG